jgi:hypothetical protein
MVKEDQVNKAKPANLVPAIKEILEEAKSYSMAVDSDPDEISFLMIDPTTKDVNREELNSIMVMLGSQKEPSGGWLPVVVEYKGDYYVVGGKDAYCG